MKYERDVLIIDASVTFERDAKSLRTVRLQSGVITRAAGVWQVSTRSLERTKMRRSRPRTLFLSRLSLAVFTMEAA